MRNPIRFTQVTAEAGRPNLAGILSLAGRLALAVGLSFGWTLLPTVLAAAPARGADAQAQIQDFEIVETTPVETELDNAHIRDTYGVWLEMIGKANRTLDFEEFYISNAPGEPLEDVLKAVIDAAQRGVTVRFVVDAGMYKTYPEMVDSLEAVENIEVRKIDMRSVSGGPMHAKYFVVDKEELFLGSQNFDWRALKHIHELGCRVRSKELCQVFSDLFDLDWELAENGRLYEFGRTREARELRAESGGRAGEVQGTGAESSRAGEGDYTEGCGMLRQYELPLSGEAEFPHQAAVGTGEGGQGVSETITVWPVYSPGDCIPDSRQWDEAKIVALIDSAASEVLVQLLTYSALDESGYYDALDGALRRAGGRGASVRLLVSDWAKGSPNIDCLKSLELMPNIEVRLSTIPEWSGGFIPYSRVEHCKYMVVDGAVSWIGTSNWDRSYFHEARNAGLVVESKGLGKMLHDVFYKSWSSKYAYPVKPEVTYTRPKRND